MKFLKRGKSPPKYGLDSVCSAREQITAFGLYCSLSGQAFAESSFTPSPKGSALKNPILLKSHPGATAGSDRIQEAERSVCHKFTTIVEI